MDLREALRGKLTAVEQKQLVTSFEIVGDIAIIEIPGLLDSKKRLIGNAIMGLHKNVKTVLRKVSGRKGAFRTKDYELIAGEDKTETEHKENGCRFLVDVSKVYFSPREVTERMRIVKQVSEGEIVLVMFAGVGPYAIEIGKLAKPESIYAVEINPVAVEYAKRNAVLNKVAESVFPVEANVRRFFPGIKFDRIVMPLPTGAHGFLDDAFRLAKRGATIHYYAHGPEKNLYGEAEKELKAAAKKAKRKIKIVGRTVVLPYAPHVFKVCLDVKT